MQNYVIEFYQVGIYKRQGKACIGPFLKLLAEIDNCPLSSVVVVLVKGVRVGPSVLALFREKAFAGGLYGSSLPPRRVPYPVRLPELPCLVSDEDRDKAWRKENGIEEKEALAGVSDEVFKSEAVRINRSAAKALRKAKRVKGALPPCGGVGGKALPTVSGSV